MKRTIKLTGDRQRQHALQCVTEAPQGYCVTIAEETRFVLPASIGCARKIRPVKLRKQPPALTTRRKDRPMASKPVIAPMQARQSIPATKDCAQCGCSFQRDSGHRS